MDITHGDVVGEEHSNGFESGRKATVADRLAHFRKERSVRKSVVERGRKGRKQEKRYLEGKSADQHTAFLGYWVPIIQL